MMDYVDSKIEEEIIQWRRYLHQHPELSYEEKKTAEFIKAQLQSFGNIEISELTPNSVIGVLKGELPGKIIALRADMDALPIEEEADVSFRSLNSGKMHACGHDAHMAMLLGTAKILSTLKKNIKGTIKFIFQPAEEQQPGGAIELTQKGVVDGVDMIFGQHVLIIPGMKVGTIATKSGPFMAACDGINLTIKGVGTHSSTPQNGINPINVCADIISSLNQIVSTKISAFKNTVVTVCAMNSGNVDNVIPDNANLLGTVRTTDPESRELIETEIKKTVKNICEMYGVDYELVYDLGYSPVVNDSQATEIVIQAGEKVLGKDNVLHVEPVMASEDFSGYLDKIPGCFFLLGAGLTEEGYGYMNHSPKFEIDERILKIGTNMFVQIITDILVD